MYTRIIYINFQVFEREINIKYANLLELDEIILDIEALCYDKDAVNKMRMKIVELENKLNKLSPLSQQVNSMQIIFLTVNIICDINKYIIFCSKRSTYLSKLYLK